MGYSKAEYLQLLSELEGKKKGKRKARSGTSKEENSKFNNTKTTVDGITFDSKKEADRYCELKLLLRAGIIENLRLQVPYVLSEGVKLHGESRKKPDLRYVADFVYFDKEKNKEIVEDVKSEATKNRSEFRTKKHLMKNIHGIDVIEV